MRHFMYFKFNENVNFEIFILKQEMDSIVYLLKVDNPKRVIVYKMSKPAVAVMAQILVKISI